MILWRRGESPTADIELAVEAARDFLELVREGRARQELFVDFAFPQLVLYGATGRFDLQLDGTPITRRPIGHLAKPPTPTAALLDHVSRGG